MAHQSIKAGSKNWFLFEECITAWISLHQPKHFGSNLGFFLGGITKKWNRIISIHIEEKVLYDSKSGYNMYPPLFPSWNRWNKLKKGFFSRMKFYWNFLYLVHPSEPYHILLDIFLLSPFYFWWLDSFIVFIIWNASIKNRWVLLLLLY